MYRYWTPHQRERLDAVDSLDAAGVLAVEILEGMKAAEQPIIQVCGPMSTGGLGSLKENMARFARAVHFLQDRGFCVFNQIPFQSVIIRVTDHHDGGPYRMDILEVFYRKIFECGHVSAALFLPGWESSRGATWERQFVVACGIRARDFPRRWLQSLG